MSSSTSFTTSPCLSPASLFTNRGGSVNKLGRNRMRIIGREKTNFSIQSRPIFAVNSSVKIRSPVGSAGGEVPEKLRRLVTEFRSLTEPIDRVKRLLHYAAVLPHFEESARIPENKVNGCTTQVWLDAWMDNNGKIRFRADSDSEITKGFCSCLIWLLDGADPEEVVRVRGEELAEMNVGVHGKAQSRVNTWHNVLMSMQKRTREIVAARGSGKAVFGSAVVNGAGAGDVVCCVL